MKRKITPASGSLFLGAKINICLVPLLLTSLFSCSISNNTITSPVIKADNENAVISDIKADKGASFSVRINFSSGFQTKNNLSGVTAKTPADIQVYHVYLLKKAVSGGYPITGDPIGDAVAGPIPISNSGATSRLVTFINVPSSGTDFYYVAIRALDGLNNDLIQFNNGTSGVSWSGTTAVAPFLGRVAVSTGTGISVNSSLQVSSTTPLSIIPNLQNGFSASLEAKINPSPGLPSLPSAVLPDNYIETYAGSGTVGGFSGDGLQATSATLNNPNGLAFDIKGNLYIADSENHRIRKVNLITRKITTVAGDGIPCPDSTTACGDTGAATSAQLNFPTSIVFDKSGNLIFADGENNRIRKINRLTGIISTIAGTGAIGFVGDTGPATSAELEFPAAIAVDSTDNIYFADKHNHKIRKIDSTSSIITTIAGNGTQGLSGDGGQATLAQLNNPRGLTINPINNDIIICDTDNSRIRRVNTSGVITTIAGGGTGQDNIRANASTLMFPAGIVTDVSGNVFFSDTSNSVIRMIKAANGNIVKLSGTYGAFNYSGDSAPAFLAELNEPRSLAFDKSGNLFFADALNHRIRRIF